MTPLTSPSIRRHAIMAILLMLLVNLPSQADWLTLPGSFTHDPSTAQRIDQYAPKAPSHTVGSNSFQASGYRQYRSTIQYGQAADNYHRVEKWGEPVQPYGEWRFPFRPYSSPYPNWGAPYAGLNIGGGFGGGFRGRHPGSGVAWPPIAGGGMTGENPDPAMPGGGRGTWHPDAGYFGPGGASITPYPPIPSGGYPVPPYYDGFYPTYGETPRLNDRQFYFKPQQDADKRIVEPETTP